MALDTTYDDTDESTLAYSPTYLEDPDPYGTSPYSNPWPDSDATYSEPAPAPTTTTAPAPTPTTAPAPTGPSRPVNGNYQQWFQSLIQGKPANSATLLGLEAELGKYGVRVLRNASGIAGKIQLPGGQIIDVGGKFSSGNPSRMTWQWLQGSGGADRSNSAPTTGGYEFGVGVPTGKLGSLLQPYGKEFTAPEDATLPTPDYGEFIAPDAAAMLRDPGYQFRMDAGRKALEASAAAKGTLRTGGTLKDLLQYGQAFGSQEYNNVFNRNLAAYDANRTTNAGLYDRQAGRANDIYGRAWNEYQQDWNRWATQNRDVFDRLSWQADFGKDAARI